MTSIDDAKSMARRLREELLTQAGPASPSRALELVARSLGHRDWNTFVASEDTGPLVVPILRTFPGGEAISFYRDFLGFAIDWEHQFEVGLPWYRQVSKDGVVLHLSEHHADATPGSAVRVRVTDVRALQRQLLTNSASPLRIGVEVQEWGEELSIPDPFGNTLIFHEPS